MQQKERNINKAKCHQCLPTYRHHPFVCSEMTSGPFGKYNGIHTTVLSSCSANDIMSVAFPFNLKRGKGRNRMPKEFGVGCHSKRMPLRQHGAHREPLDEGKGEPARGAGFCGRQSTCALSHQSSRERPCSRLCGSQPGQSRQEGW